MKETLKDRLTSRRFLLTVAAVMTAIASGLAGVMSWPDVAKTCALAIVPFILGQSYVEGKVAEFVPPALQQQLIESAAIALANKFVGNKVAQVTAVLSPSATIVDLSTVSPGEASEVWEKAQKNKVTVSST